MDTYLYTFFLCPAISTQSRSLAKTSSIDVQAKKGISMVMTHSAVDYSLLTTSNCFSNELGDGLKNKSVNSVEILRASRDGLLDSLSVFVYASEPRKTTRLTEKLKARPRQERLFSFALSFYDALTNNAVVWLHSSDPINRFSSNYVVPLLEESRCAPVSLLPRR